MSDDFAALVRTHQAAVCATAYAVLRDRARSEEIAQDAFLVAWQKLRATELAIEPAQLPAWICGVARNLARNAARKRREVAMTDDDPPGTDSPLATTLRREHVDLANRALAALPDADRELVVLFYRCDESIGDVSRTLAIPEATTRKRLQRTRERLRDALASVEAMLRATRPGPAFTVACVAALATGRIPEAAAAPRTSLKLAVLGGAVLAVIATATAVLVSRTTSTDSSVSAPSTSAASPGSARTPLPAGIRHISSTDRAAMLARLRARRPTGAAVESRVYDFADTRIDTTAPDDKPIPTLTKTTLRRAIARLHPMLRACGDGHGRLATTLRLAGEERGTIVELVEITGDPPLSDDADFVECVRTTLESLELPPTNDPVPWDVSYPFVF